MIDNQLLTQGLFGVFAIYGAYSDVRRRVIPNLLTLTMALVGLLSVWLLSGSAGLLASGLHFALALGIGMLVFALRMWGGGDAKFYAATAAWFDWRQFPLLASAIAIAGLILVISWFTIARLMRKPAAGGRKAELPYGLAIAVGGLATLFLQDA